MASKNNNVFSAQYPSGAAFVGAIIIGIGVGMLKHETGQYTLLGVGVGFVLVALFSMTGKNKHLDR